MVNIKNSSNKIQSKIQKFTKESAFRGLIVIDSSVQDYNGLLSAMKIPADTLILDADNDGIITITNILKNNRRWNSLYLVCHGKPGEIQLGKTRLNFNTIQEYQSQLQQWKISDILLYSCCVASKSHPQNHLFLQQLHQFTNANLAASSTAIGCAEKGGDWQLDFSLGSVLSPTAFSLPTLATYPHTLAIEFEESANNLPQVRAGSAAWGDIDNNGTFEIIITGLDEAGNPIAEIYQSNGNNFNPIPSALEGVSSGSVDWGDYDNDNNLDLLITGLDVTQTPRTLIYRNNPEGNNNNSENNDNDRFQELSLPVGVSNSDGLWIDFDNDGDQDIVLTGQTVDGSPFSEIYRNDGNNIFTPIAAGLTPVFSSSIAAGDYDSDGDDDLVITGNNGTNLVAEIYENNNGNFTNIDAALTDVENGSVAWGDYDNDGDLDLILGGNNGVVPVAEIYQNNNNTFTQLPEDTADFVGVEESTVAWQDYDNDGDLDAVVAGSNAGGAPGLVIVYENDNGNFTNPPVFLPNASEVSDIATADTDGDGDLDLLVSGFNTLIYNNTGATPNTPPTPPVLANQVVTGNTVNLSWQAATDLETPANGLTYNLRVGTTPGGLDLVNPTLTTPSSGNVGSNTDWQLQNLTPGTYYWSVQAVDSAYVISDPAIENSFTIEPPQFNELNLGLPDLRNGSVAWGDYDNSGTLDLLITGVDATGNAFTQIYQSGGGGFGNINAGLPGVTASAVDWGDYDNDGNLDFILTGNDPSTGNDVSRIYRNNGNNSFININAGLVGVSNGAAVWGDYDNDGDLDIVIAGESNGIPTAIIYRNETAEGNGFVNSNSILTPVLNAAAAWGDYDNDGDLDLVVTGNDGTNPVSILYRNENGIFDNQNAALTNVENGSVAWGDYDNDGDLDLLLTGSDGNIPVSQIYRNDGGSFTNINANLVGVQQGEGVWGDYDNDGDLDIVITGVDSNGNPISTIYQNDGVAGFTPLDSSGLANLESSSVAWGDLNNDNTLDLVLMGADAAGIPLTRLYQNTATPDNTPPSPPTNLTAVANGSQITLSWDTATDLETPATGLTYNLQVGTTPGGTDILSPLSIGNGQRQVVQIGNTQQNTSWTINNLTPGIPYYWSVQAVDSSFVGSQFAIATDPVTLSFPTYNFSQPNYTTPEGNITNTVSLVEIIRTGDITIAENVTVSLIGESATAGNDFTADPVIVNFGVGETVKQVPIEILGDQMTEGDETLQLTLGGFDQGGVVEDQNSAILTLSNDDTSGVVITPPVSNITSEAGDTSSFDLVLTSQPTADVTVNLASDTPTEGDVIPAVTFTPDNWDIPQTVTVTGVDDNSVDGNRNYTILTSVTSLDGFYNGFDPEDIVFTNTDDDVANILVTPTEGLTTTEVGGIATFSVILNSQPNDLVTVNLNSDNPTEGFVSTSTLNFNPQNWDTPQTVTVTGVDDDIADGEVLYNIILDAAISNDPNYTGINPADVTVSNADNESPGVTVNPTEGLTTTEAGNFANFEVVLNTQPIDTVSFSLNSSDTTEGTVSVSTLNFTPENWNLPQVVTVTGVNDDFADGDVAYTIEIAADANTSDPDYQVIDPTNVNIVNEDNNTADIVVSPTTGLVTSEAAGNDTFTVVLTSQPVADVIVNLESNNPAEGRVSTETLTFTATNWQTPQTVTVTGVDDTIADGNQPYQIVTTSSSQDISYIGVDPDDVTVVNTDDDNVGVDITPTTGLITAESGTVATFDVVLTAQPTADVLLNFNSSNPLEGNVLSPTIGFTPTNWNIPQMVTVVGVDDGVADGNVTYSIVSDEAISADLSYNGFNPDDVTVVNVDNETPGITINPLNGLTTSEAEETDSFNVVLNTQPTGNVILNLSSSDETEGTVATPQLIFTPDNWNTPQIVTVTGVDDTEIDGDREYSIITAPTISINPDDGSINSDYDGIDPDDVTVTNIDNDVPGVNLLVTPNVGSEAEATLITVTASTTNPVNGNQTVDLRVDGTGITNTDYTLSDTVITIPNGENSGSVTFAIQNDELVEGDEEATLTLINPTAGIELGSNTTSNIRILDNNNPAIVEFSQGNYQLDEAGNLIGVAATLNRSGNLSGTSTVELFLTGDTATAGVDFNDALIPVNFAANEIEKTVSIPILEDRVIENEETFNLELVNPGLGTQIGNQNTATVTIEDNDQVGITLTQTNLSVVEAGEAETYSIFLTSLPQNPVTINFEFDEQQLEPISPIVFDDTNWNIPQTISVLARGNDGIEGIQQTAIRHQVTSDDENYNNIELDEITVEIIELQSPGILIEPTSLSVVEGIQSDSYNISLTTVPDDLVTLQFNTGSQLNSIEDITFDQNNWNIPQTVIVSAFDDINIEGIHSGSITHQLISNDEDYNLSGIGLVAVEIVDNDEEDNSNEPGGVQIIPGNLTVSESGTVGTYDFVLTTEPTSAVTINVATGNQINPILPITFNASNWNIPQTISFTAIDDAVVQGDRSVNLSHSITSEDQRYSQLIITDVEVTITDNDTATPTNPTNPNNPNNPNPNLPPTVEIVQDNNRTDISEGGISDFYTVVLNTPPTAEVVVTLNPDSQVNLGNGTEVPVELIFTPDNWNFPQVVTVAAEDDTVVETDVHTSTINHTVSSADPNYGISPLITIDGIVSNNLTVNIEDNDEPLPPGTPGVSVTQTVRNLNVLEGFGEDTYWLALESEPTAEVLITIQPNSQIQTNQQTITFTPSNWNQRQQITVTAIDDNIPNEGDHSTILFHTATSLDPRYNDISVSNLEIEIADNDNFGLQLNLTELSTLEFTGGDDVIIASGEDDNLYGLEGNDQLMGMAGRDYLVGQAGSDGIAGGSGDDIILGGQGNDHLYGNQANDLIVGDSGSDRLFGGPGNDQLSGGSGNDRLSPDRGTDTLTGGQGQDVFVLGSGTGGLAVSQANVITDFIDTQDTIELVGSLSADQLNFIFTDEGTLLQIRSTGEYIALLSGVSFNLSSQGNTALF